MPQLFECGRFDRAGDDDDGGFRDALGPLEHTPTVCE
jgi:hypothetical protein